MVALSERYLGLPTVVGRSKDGSFKHGREASRPKVVGWKGQGLSKATRKVLIKSRLQAAPTYAMSCFQLSKKICLNLTSISSNFLWGAANDERIVHWVAWDKLSTRKHEGGLGFRDLDAKVFSISQTGAEIAYIPEIFVCSGSQVVLFQGHGHYGCHMPAGMLVYLKKHHTCEGPTASWNHTVCW